MSTAPLEIDGVVRASELDRQGRHQQQDVVWDRSLLEGRLAEVSGEGAAASLTLSLSLVRESQLDGQPVAWVATGASAFFPPDARRHGIDLEALPVVRVPDGSSAGRAADKLVRSGGFGLVVVDLGGRFDQRQLSELARPLQKRLLQHAERHDTAVLFITDKSPEAPSVGGLFSFRAQTTRQRHGGDQFACRVEALVDNRFGPGWSREEVYGGPPGLR